MRKLTSIGLERSGKAVIVTKPRVLDSIDARILLHLTSYPRTTAAAVADSVGISRNTAQSRMSRLESPEVLDSFDRRVRASALGYPLTALVTAVVTQRSLDRVAVALEAVPEVTEVNGISGDEDLLIRVVARDADDLYRIAGRLLAIPGVERTSTALVMRPLVDFRVAPLLQRLAQDGR